MSPVPRLGSLDFVVNRAVFLPHVLRFLLDRLSYMHSTAGSETVVAEVEGNTSSPVCPALSTL